MTTSYTPSSATGAGQQLTSLIAEEMTTVLASNSSNVSSNDTADYGMLITVYAYFWVVALIIPVGLVCNALAIVVCLGSKQIRRTTTGHYMVALAVADLVYLSGEVMRVLNMSALNHYITGIKFMDEYNIACKLIYFVRYSGQFACAWLTVAITAERCLTIALPLKVASLSTTGKTKIIIVAIATLAFGLTSYTLWTIGIDKFEDGHYYCMFLGDGRAYDHWTMGVITLGSVLVPCCLVFKITGIILTCLYRARSRRRHHMEGQKQRAVAKTSAQKVERQLTVTLLAVAVAFLALRILYIVTYFVKEYQVIHMPNDESLAMVLYIVNKAADCLAILNYDVNFFLYCLCGSVFRRQLVAQCTGCWRRIRGFVSRSSSSSKRASVMTMTTLHSVRSRSSVNSASYQSLMVKRRETPSVNAPSAAAMRYSATYDLIDTTYGGRSPSSPSPNVRRAPSSQREGGGGGGRGGEVMKKYSLQHHNHNLHQQLQLEQETVPLTGDEHCGAVTCTQFGFDVSNFNLSSSSLSALQQT